MICNDLTLKYRGSHWLLKTRKIYLLEARFLQFKNLRYVWSLLSEEHLSEVYDMSIDLFWVSVKCGATFCTIHSHTGLIQILVTQSSMQLNYYWSLYLFSYLHVGEGGGFIFSYQLLTFKTLLEVVKKSISYNLTDKFFMDGSKYDLIDKNLLGRRFLRRSRNWLKKSILTDLKSIFCTKNTIT
jgi:hypothetical protein